MKLQELTSEIDVINAGLADVLSASDIVECYILKNPNDVEEFNYLVTNRSGVYGVTNLIIDRLTDIQKKTADILEQLEKAGWEQEVCND